MQLQANSEINATLKKLRRNFSLTLDPLFKLVFGSPGSEQLLRAMLNAVLGKELKRPIELMWFLPQEYGPLNTADERVCRMDIVALDQTGCIYDIEMQRGYDDDYNDRLFLYVSRLISHYTPQGKEMKLQRIIGLSFGEQALPGLEGCPSPFVTVMVGTDQPGYWLRGTLPRTVHVNLPLIRKLGKEHDVESFDEQWRWCYYIALEGATATDKEKEKLNKIIDTEPNIAEAHRRYIQSLQSDDKDLQLRMLQELNAEWRYAGELATARRTGLKEGREEGLSQGRTQGLEEGKAEGKAEGRAEGMAEGMLEGRTEGMLEAKREDAKAMKTAGLDINLIIQCTGLSEKEVSAL